MGLFERSPLPKDVRDELNVLGAEFEELRAADSERLARYSRYRDEIENVGRDNDLDTAIGTLDYRRERKNSPEFSRHRITLPYAQATTVKHANRIAGRMPDVIVDRREESAQERHRSDTIEKIVWGIHRESNGEVCLSGAAWDGSQIGSACFEAYFDPRRQMPLYRDVDPASVVVVRGVDDPHDFERVYRFWSVPLASLQAQYRNREFAGFPVELGNIEPRQKVDGREYVTIVQTSDRRRAVRFVMEGRVGLQAWTHDYGFTPYVVIPNLGPERKVWGWADYEFIRDLARYLPVYFGREADILKMVANGAFKVKGTKLSTSAVRRILSNGGILPVGREGDVEPVEVPQVPAFAESHLERARTMLNDLGFSPPAAWGDGAAGSGSDRGLQLQPMLELTNLKQINWGAGLSRLGSMCLRMIDLKQVEPTRYRGVAKRGARKSPFNLLIGPEVEPVVQQSDDGEDIELPRSPKELFDGDYSVRFVWQNRIDVDDPAYVASELNKFAQGVQSLRTTLERLGIQSPEDEIKLIEDEAERHPWLRDGMIKLMQMQMDASQQGQGGGQPFDPAGAMGGALDQMTTKDGSALDADAGAGALNGGIGQLYGGA